jgi:hypothetical protein
MQQKMLRCLDDVPLEQIQKCVTFPFFILGLKVFYRFANRSACFISAYHQGLSGTQAAWANKKYHGHHVLPPDMVAQVKKTGLK